MSASQRRRQRPPPPPQLVWWTLLVAAASFTARRGGAHGFAAIVPGGGDTPRTQVFAKPLNMTRKAKTPPAAAWQLADQAAADTQEWDVDRYQDQHSFVWQYGSSLIDMVFENDDHDATTTGQDSSSSSSEWRILDVGCGSGELTAQLAQRGGENCQVTGMDADAAMIRRAREQFPHLCFVQADVRDFDPAHMGAPFDVVFSNAALHWVPPADVDRAVARLSRALRPQTGRLVVEFGGRGNVRAIVEATQDRLGLEDDASSSPWYFPSIADFTRRLEEHGIEVTQAALYDRPTPLADGADGMANWLRMFGHAFWKDLPQDDKVDAVLQEVADRVRPTLWDGQEWKADYRRIRVVGRKL